MEINTQFDFRTDAHGKDPDLYSATLRRYHQLLWSKPLPDGTSFDLDVTTQGGYLHHRSGRGEFFLSSDSVIPTFTGYLSLKPITDQLSASDGEALLAIGYTIGGMIVWPSNRIGRKLTINGARGFLRRIADRMDLTLECIRLHYLSRSSPLGDVLARYSDFFALFEDFPRYLDFFLLQDLVTDDHSAVRFFMPFCDFTTPSIPTDVDTYREYMRRSIEFIEARNRRIQVWTIN